MIIFVRRCPRQKLLCPFTFLLLLGILAFAASDPEQVRIFYFCYHKIHLNGSTLNHYQFAQFAQAAHFYIWMIFLSLKIPRIHLRWRRNPLQGPAQRLVFSFVVVFVCFQKLYFPKLCFPKLCLPKSCFPKLCFPKPCFPKPCFQKPYIFWKWIGELIVGPKLLLRKAYSATASSELSRVCCLCHRCLFRLIVQV